MGICLALSILEHGGVSAHGGRAEAIDELIRESFWMTEAEIAKAQAWATAHSPFLSVAMDVELTRRRANAPIGYRAN